MGAIKALDGIVFFELALHTMVHVFRRSYKIHYTLRINIDLTGLLEYSFI
jgi:hypothetical protein